MDARIKHEKTKGQRERVCCPQTSVFLLVAGFGLLAAACSKEQDFGNSSRSKETTAVADAAGAGELDKTANQPPSDNAESSPVETAEKPDEVDADLLKHSRDPESLVIDLKSQSLIGLVCQQSFDLDAVSPNKSVVTDEAQLVWATTDPTIIRVDNKGTATVVGYGKATLIALSEKADGTKIQDHLQIEVTAKDARLIAENATPIKPIVTATATKTGDAYTNFIDGKAGGRIRLRHPERTISIASVESLINSTDFGNFKFSDVTKPSHNPETCSYTVEFNVEFTYLYVPAVTKYLGQQLQVSFAEGTGRAPFKINWSAILVPDGVKGADAENIINTGTGATGFSPKK